MQVTECPQCGASAKPSDKICEYCKAEFFITSLAYLGKFDSGGVNKYLQQYKKMTVTDPASAEGFLGLGLCYLQLGMYPLAQQNLENVIEMAPEMAHAYYYAALACVQGRRLMTMALKEIREIETYLSTAIQLDGDFPVTKILLAMLKLDYYKANGMRIAPPQPDDLLGAIAGREVNRIEWERLVQCVRVGDFSPFETVTLT